MQIRIQATDTGPLTDQLFAVSRNFGKELWIAVSKTANWGKKQAVKHAYKEVNTSQKVLGKMFYVKRREPYTATIYVRQSKARTGISMRHFSPRITSAKRGGGVSVNAYDRGGGRVNYPKAFTFPRRANSTSWQVYERFGSGRKDYRELRYPHTVDTFRNASLQVTLADINGRLQKEIADRIRFNVNRINGTLRGKQPKAV